MNEVFDYPKNKAVESVQTENVVLTAKTQALTERNEFLEDLIAELAVQVYSTPPSA